MPNYFDLNFAILRLFRKQLQNEARCHQLEKCVENYRHSVGGRYNFVYFGPLTKKVIDRSFDPTIYTA